MSQYNDGYMYEAIPKQHLKFNSYEKVKQHSA